MAGEQEDRDGSTNRSRSYSLAEYMRIVDLLIQKGKLRDKIYTPRSVEASTMVSIQLVLQHNGIELAYPRIVTLSFHPATGKLQTSLVYDCGMPYEVADVIPILTQQEKIQMYEALGFPILPPTANTFAITKGNAAYVVLSKMEKCPLTNKIPGTKSIPPAMLNYKPPGADRMKNDFRKKWSDFGW